VDFANSLDGKTGWILNNDIVDGSQPKPMTLIGSDLSTVSNCANPRWIEHNGLVKNVVNKCMFTLYIEKICPDNNERQWVVNGRWQSKKNEGFALLLKRRQFKFGSLAMAFPPCSRILLSRKIMWLKSMRMFGPFLLQ
jgi:hypothetical protein